MASPDRASAIAIRAAAALLPVLLGGGTPLGQWINPFWQLLFGSGVVIVTYVLPATEGAHWHPIGIALVPWLVAAAIYAISGRLTRSPPLVRRLSIIAYLSSFAVIVPLNTLPELDHLPLYVNLLAQARPL